MLIDDHPMSCKTQSCEAIASNRVHWPGRTVRLCLGCTERALRLADVMGFVLTIEDLPKRWESSS